MILHKPIRVYSLVSTLVLLLASPPLSTRAVAAGSTYSILHSFGDGSVMGDGIAPSSSLISGSDGNLYGMTPSGGPINAGVVFKMTPAGIVTVLHTFGDGTVNNDGEVPLNSLTQGSDGNLYGTTIFGGSLDDGTVFKIAPDGSNYTIIHSFGSVNNDGTLPLGNLTQGHDGNFYGTVSPGRTEQQGLIFRVAPDGSNYAVLHSFGSVAGDGSEPRSGLTQGTDGDFYGTTDEGGSAGAGILYRISPGGAFKILHNFGDGSTQNDGTNSLSAPIEGPEGYLYGMTNTGGSASSGIAYRFLPEHLLVSAPAASTAGSPFNITVTALDDTGAIVTSYNGTIHFTSDDSTAILPADTTLINGSRTFSLTLHTAAQHLLRITDTAASATTTTAGVTINAAALDHLTLTAPATASTGMAFLITLAAKDRFENAIKSFADTIHLSSTSAQSVLPADFALSGGAKPISVKLNSPGIHTITATDAAHSVTVTSAHISVGATATKLVVAAPDTATAGSHTTFTIRAEDALGNLATGYSGTVHFTSTDSSAVLPANATLINSVKAFSITLKKAATSTITITDTANASIKGTAVIVVSPGAATNFAVVSPTSAMSNTAFPVNITAKDAFGNVAKGYAGTVHFTSTDPLAVLPANIPLQNGTKQVVIKLKTHGSQKITATVTVNSAIKGTSPTIAVN